MRASARPLAAFGACALAFGMGRTGIAAPTIRLIPPDGARYLPDQRFDVRAEFAPSNGATLSAMTITIAGRSVNVTLGQLSRLGE